MIDAFRRERKLYEFAPVWFGTGEVADLAADVIRKRQKKLDDQAARDLIDKGNQEQLKRRKAEEEVNLRAENGPRARALRDRIDKMVKDAAVVIEREAIEKSEHGPVEAENIYPEYALWLASRAADGWNTKDVRTEIQDFGSIQWNGRPLEGVLLKAIVTQQNALRGENDKEACFAFGLVYDAEFSMLRDPISVQCKSSDRAIAMWKVRRQFRSRWNWQPEFGSLNGQ
jgi:hypothetical protein